MLAMLLAAAVVTADPPLSPAAQSLIASVQASIDKVREQQAALPPPKDDSERIMRLHDLDQAPRQVVVAFDFSTLKPEERKAVTAHVSALIEPVDRADNDALAKLVPPEGWFTISNYGKSTAWAAFDIVQHGGDQVRERWLPVLGRFVASGEVPGEAFGMMYDRVQITHNRPQRFGSQFRCDGGKWRPYPIEDPDHVEERRKSYGFGETFADAKGWEQSQPPCPQTQRPPPTGMKLD
ncbi:MAG TPA: DUF6624 domain-containing protein [Caulobacteraceae bacterium]|jgi:hypothetical protein|nr:DUF6624 domain-containing protein [Caulobacteraceae bacterium]